MEPKDTYADVSVILCERAWGVHLKIISQNQRRIKGTELVFFLYTDRGPDGSQISCLIRAYCLIQMTKEDRGREARNDVL